MTRIEESGRKGYFGEFGGQFFPDTLYPAIEQLSILYDQFRDDQAFNQELNQLLKEYVGRPSPLTFSSRLSEELGVKIYLKREDLNHTGAHKINNCLGQILLAKKMNKSRIIAETGAGQHGVATATVCAKMGFECVIYMGEEDMKRQALNVYRMELLGATVVPVYTGSRTLKDATSEAMRDWLKSLESTHYIVGSVVGPHPFPTIVRDFQSVIGKEARDQILEKEGRVPDSIFACVGGGSNAIGIFSAFVQDQQTQLVAVEAAGEGLETDRHSASLDQGSPGILHGALSYVLQEEDGQIQLAHSISAGLDYPGVGPELSFLKKSGRLVLGSATDREACEACRWVSQKEGIIPALETAHAFAELKKKRYIKPDDLVLINVSGRGDKDMETMRQYVK